MDDVTSCPVGSRCRLANSPRLLGGECVDSTMSLLSGSCFRGVMFACDAALVLCVLSLRHSWIEIEQRELYVVCSHDVVACCDCYPLGLCCMPFGVVSVILAFLL